MPGWDIFITKLGTLFVTLGFIFTSYSLPSEVSVAPVPDVKSNIFIPREVPEVFPDYEEAEELKVIIPSPKKVELPNKKIAEPESPSLPEIPEPENVPDVIVDVTSLVDLKDKLAKLTEELRETLSDKETPTSLFTISDVNNKTRNSLVNIFCISHSPAVRSVTGSGVIVDERGVIITNSHVAQLFLLLDYPQKNNVDCVIRSGSPASPLYKARLLYMPYAWLKENSTVLTDPNPQGTGENDYAFLLIESALSGNKPQSFNYLVPLIDDDLEKNKTVVVAGYAAGFLSSYAIQNELFPVSAVAKITDLFTFGGNTLDIFSVAGTMVAQRGSSGGAAVDEDGRLIGIIVTSTDSDNPADREMRAISLAHINRSLKSNRGTSLSALLSGDLSEKAQNFESLEAPQLRKILIESLQN